MSKHDRTLASIFASPARANIKCRNVEAMIISMVGTVEERGGSRVVVSLNGHNTVFHRPHPSPDTDKGAVKSLRRFLQKAGVTP